MGKLAFKIVDEKFNKEYIIEWSNISNYFISYGMSEDQYREHCREEYGNEFMINEFEDDLKRINKTGSNSRTGLTTLDYCINNNFNGKNEDTMSKEEILENYCRNRNN